MKERPRTLLIGDDETRMAELRRILSRAARVSQAEDIPQALQWLARDGYDAA